MRTREAPVFTELYTFLASAPTHAEILAYRPSPTALDRLSLLRTAEQSSTLSEDEHAELDEWERAEHFVRMLKLHTAGLHGSPTVL